MTAYHGSKKRIGKELAKIMYKTSTDIEDKNFVIKGYCEPFSGMMGVFEHIPELFEEHKPKLKYIAGDVNTSVIKMWNSAKKGWVPPIKTTKTQYEHLKTQKASALKGFIGHAYGFGGIYFGAYRAKYLKTNKNKQSSDNVVKIAKKLKNVSFVNKDYTDFSKLKGFIIYCDPPYSKYSRYYDEKLNKLKFDSEKFWDWCRHMSKHNIVFVSEYSAPKDFKKIWTKNVTVNYNNIKSSNTEKLFLLH